MNVCAALALIVLGFTAMFAALALIVGVCEIYRTRRGRVRMLRTCSSLTRQA